MSDSTSTVSTADIIKGILVNGGTTDEAQKFIELTQILADLDPKQQLVRAKALNEFHVGQLVHTVNDVELGYLDDIDYATIPAQFGPRPLQTAYHRIHQDEVEEDDFLGERRVVRGRGQQIVVVINGKINRFSHNTLLKLTETRDI